MTEIDWGERCQHIGVEEVRSMGGDLLAFQCTACLKQVKLCKDCQNPLTFRHAERSIGCVKCGRGMFCNAKTPLCKSCAPVQDGICKSCHHPFPRTGRSARARKAYCDEKCSRRAQYLRDLKKRGELPPATSETSSGEAV